MEDNVSTTSDCMKNVVVNNDNTKTNNDAAAVVATTDQVLSSTLKSSSLSPPPKKRQPRKKKKPLQDIIKTTLPTQIDTLSLQRFFNGFHYILLAYYDFCAAKELLQHSVLFPQIIFNFQQAAEKLLKALLFILKSDLDHDYHHNLTFIADNFEDIELTLFRRVTASFEQIGQASKSKNKDYRSLAVRCRYPQTKQLPVEVFTLHHAHLSEKFTYIIAHHVFDILAIVFKTCSPYNYYNRNNNNNNNSSSSNKMKDNPYLGFWYKDQRAQFIVNTRLLILTKGKTSYSISFC